MEVLFIAPRFPTEHCFREGSQNSPVLCVDNDLWNDNDSETNVLGEHPVAVPLCTLKK